MQIVATLTGFILFCIIFLGTTNDDTLEKVPYGAKLQEGVHHAVEEAKEAVDRVNPFGTPAHTPPPEQVNSSIGDTRWHSDWRWRNPFSSSTTLDEERAVLPPLNNRPPIYTYYDVSQRRKDPKSRQAEQDLIQVWRRAWWAQGFRPVVLSKSEAMNNPHFRTMQHMHLADSVENELMRWLAWGNMGTGILANFLALPMAAYDDPMLSFLRRGEYPFLQSYLGLDNGFYVGSKLQIDTALKEMLSSKTLRYAKSFDEAMPHDTLRVEKQPEAIAYYSTANLKEKYPPVREKLEESSTVPDAMAMLPSLINSHLHQTWQNNFPKGIAVLKPLARYTTALIEPAIEIARNLTQCPVSPIQGSCPPNIPKCKSCVSNSLKISTPKIFRNDSSLFTIGTVPHPYTIQSLVTANDHIDLKFIRRESKRDIWLMAATKEILGTGISAYARLPTFKDAVASPFGSARSLWISAERPYSKDSDEDRKELDWIFGFELPRETISTGESKTPIPGRPEPPDPVFGDDGKPPTQQELQTQKDLLEKAKLFIQSGRRSAAKEIRATREQIEAWNLGDTEAWKFIRAWNVRRRSERMMWQKEEELNQGKGTFDRFIDRIT